MKKLIYILLFYSLVGFSQNNENSGFPHSIEIQTGIGYIGQHTDILSYYITGHVPNVNINIGKKLTGNKQWHKLYAYPEIGLGYYFAYLNNEYLGSAHAVYSYIKLPFTKKEMRLKPTFDFAIGLTYISTPFDIETNYQNRVIGTHFNVYFKAGFGFDYKLNDNFVINSVIGVNHYSNAKIKTPNLGINVLNINVGVKYLLKSPEIIEKEYTNTDYKKNEFLVVYGSGIKATPKPLNRRYYASSLVFDYYHRVSQKSKFGLGIDGFYDGSLSYYPSGDTVCEVKHWSDDFLLGAHLSYALIFNKVSYNLQLGYYLHDKLNINGEIYTRIGLRAYVTKRILLNLTLKTHFAKADLLEVGIGYKIF